MKLAPEAVAARKKLARQRPAGRGAPRGIWQRLPVRPGARHRRRDRLQGLHRRHRRSSSAAPASSPALSASCAPWPSPTSPRAATRSTASSPGPPRTAQRGWPAARLDPVRPTSLARTGPRDPAPLPALINLLVPAGTLLGWGTAPAQAAGWGLLDADETRALVQAAVQAPENPLVHDRHRPRRHRDRPRLRHGPAPLAGTLRPPQRTPEPASGTPTPGQAAQLSDLLRRLNVTFEPVARDTCDHRHAEDRYVPSRKLRHLLRARNQTCTAPACNAQAMLLRPRPHGPVPRRPHGSVQPQPEMPPSPSDQAGPRLEGQPSPPPAPPLGPLRQAAPTPQPQRPTTSSAVGRP